MVIEIDVYTLLEIINLLFSPYQMNEEDDTDLYFPDRNTFLNFKEKMTEQVENLTEFWNVFGGGFLVDKSESVAQLTLFIGDEDGLSSLTKTFSINY